MSVTYGIDSGVATRRIRFYGIPVPALKGRPKVMRHSAAKTPALKALAGDPAGKPRERG
jgi:hypothetical protein